MFFGIRHQRFGDNCYLKKGRYLCSPSATEPIRIIMVCLFLECHKDIISGSGPSYQPDWRRS